MEARYHGDFNLDHSIREPAFTVNEREQANRSSIITVADDPSSSSSSWRTLASSDRQSSLPGPFPPPLNYHAQDYATSLSTSYVPQPAVLEHDIALGQSSEHFPVNTQVIRPPGLEVTVDWARDAEVESVIADLMVEGWVIIKAYAIRWEPGSSIKWEDVAKYPVMRASVRFGDAVIEHFTVRNGDPVPRQTSPDVERDTLALCRWQGTK